MKVELLNYTKDGVKLITEMAKSTRQNELKWITEFDEIKEDIKDLESKNEFIVPFTIKIEELESRGTPKQQAFIKHLIKVGHLGILEHINFTFYVSEVSRCLTHQLVRHRIASYLQQSNRHVTPDKNSYVTPFSITNNTFNDNHKSLEYYNEVMNLAYDTYRNLIARGVPVEDARYILPPAFYQHISITMNARTLRHFFELRCEPDAQWEIRELANKMLEICYEKYPVVFEDLKEKYLDE